LACLGKLGCKRRWEYRGARLVRLARLRLNDLHIRPGTLFSLLVSMCEGRVESAQWKKRERMREGTSVG
jgi:hypothetical protein